MKPLIPATGFDYHWMDDIHIRKELEPTLTDPADVEKGIDEPLKPGVAFDYLRENPGVELEDSDGYIWKCSDDEFVYKYTERGSWNLADNASIGCTIASQDTFTHPAAKEPELKFANGSTITLSGDGKASECKGITKLPADVDKDIDEAFRAWGNSHGSDTYDVMLKKVALAILTECRRIAKEECGR